MRAYLRKAKTAALVAAAFLAAPFIFAKNIFGKKDGQKLKILVIPQLTRIGDLVCATPVFRAIKEKYPAASLSVLVSQKTVGIIKDNPRIDQIIIYEDYSLLGLIRKIYTERYNWSISLVGVSTITLVTFLGLVPQRIKTTRSGRPLSEKLTDWMSNFQIRYEDHTYLPNHYLTLLRPLGIEEAENIKEVFVTDKAKNKVAHFFSTNNIISSDVLVGVSISAGNSVKEWGDDNFLNLAKLVCGLGPYKILFVGSPSDQKRIDRLVNGLEHGRSISATTFSISELPALLKKLSLFIAVDTGLIYIAHALQVPLVDIIGPVDPREQPPADALSLQVLPPVSIKPSSFVFKSPGSLLERRQAVEAITVENVFGAVKQLLNKNRTSLS